jgi:hypothetical protein
MSEIAERISEAIGRTVCYVDIAPQEKRRALLAAGIPAERADALDELFAERRKRLESRVYLGTHEAFGVQPTSFAEFVRLNASVFRERRGMRKRLDAWVEAEQRATRKLSSRVGCAGRI